MGENPADPTLKLAAAGIAMKRKDTTRAYEKYSECIPYWDDSPVLWCGLGVLYFKNEQIKDAFIAFQRTLMCKVEFEEAWLNMGLVCELQNQFEEAVTVYQKGLAHCPESARLKERLARLQSGRAQQATYSMIAEVGHSKFFTQEAEKMAADIISNVPRIPGEILVKGTDIDPKALDECIAELNVPHHSLFSIN